MKKILALCLVVILALALVGCNNNEDVLDDVNTPVQGEQNQEISGENEENTNIDNETESGETVSGEVEKPEGNEDEVSGEKNEEVSGEKDEPVVENPDENEPTTTEGTATSMMTTLMSKAEIMVNAPMQDVIPAEMSESYIGLSEEDFNTYVTDSVFYESMISPANQSFCIIKVNDTSKVRDLKQKMFDNCNPRKWICMSAERVVVLNSGEYIMLAMASQDSCNALIPAFEAEFGKENVGTILDKTVSESIENFEGLPGADGGMAL